MKRMTSIPVLLFFLCWLCLGTGVNAQSRTDYNREEAAAWYRKGDWLKEMRLHPHASTDQLEFARQYHLHPGWWDKAFAFLRDNRLDSLKPGRYTIDGDNVYADITVNPSSELDESKWHSHRRYCDIQYVIRGKENTGVASVAGATILIPFGDKGDSQFYRQDMEGRYYLSDPDTFFIFFPSDIHRPFIRVEGSEPVKRIRFKVRAG